MRRTAIRGRTTAWRMMPTALAWALCGLAADGAVALDAPHDTLTCPDCHVPHNAVTTADTCAPCAPGWHSEDGVSCVIDAECTPSTCTSRETCVAEGRWGTRCECPPSGIGVGCADCDTANGWIWDGAGCTLGLAAACSAAGDPCAEGGTCSGAGSSCSVDCSSGHNDVDNFGVCVADETCSDCPTNADCLGIYGGEAACVCKLNWMGANDCSACATGYGPAGTCDTVDVSVCSAVSDPCAGGRGACVDDFAEFQACSDSATGGSCTGATCTGDGQDHPEMVGATDCGNKRSTVTMTHTFTTQMPNPTLFKIWIRLSPDADWDAGEDVSCTLTNPAPATNPFVFTYAALNAGTHGTGCVGAGDGNLCWASFNDTAVTLNNGAHTLSCTITTNQNSESIAFDGMIYTTDLNFVPDDESAGTCASEADFTNGLCVNWGPNTYVAPGTVYACDCSGTTGWNSDCMTCLAGYHIEDGACVSDASDPCAGVNCASASDGNGTCYLTGGDGGDYGNTYTKCDCPGTNYTGAVGTCDSCNTGWTCDCATGYTGVNCDTCDTGYVMVSGVCQADPCGGETCSGHGSCYVDGAGSAACDCDGYFYDGTNPCDTCGSTLAPGYEGAAPRLFPPGYSDTNDVCESCHKEGGAAQNKVVSSHASSSPPKDFDFLMQCNNCHQPHTQPATPHKGTGMFIAPQVHTPSLGDVAITLTATTGTNSYADGDATYDGMCEVCHTSTTRHKYDGTGTDGAHNDGLDCTQCHPHTNGFLVAWGNCLACHEGVATGDTYTRRDVVADFGRASHHAGASNYYAGQTTLGDGATKGILTNRDCVLCHMEGYIDSDGATQPDPTYHGVQGGLTTVDLRDVDSGLLVGSYDNRNGLPADVADWSSKGAAAETAAWVTRMSTVVDPFCLSCHDADGATIVGAGTTDHGDGSDPLNPFDDLTVSNEVDLADRTRVVNISDKVVSSGADLDAAGEPRGPDGIADPVDGIYSRHAINVSGGAASPYGTQQIPSANWTGGWLDYDVMSCADCHTTDGANDGARTGSSAVGNAHGSGSEYLLKDVGGDAVEGTHAGASYICYRCHTSGVYDGGNPSHSGSGSNFVDTTASTGSTRATGSGSIFGIACTNCHGGADYGSIHGTSSTYAVGSGGTREAYRFTNGNGLRFYDPQTWSAAATTCYTLGTADSFSGCTKHSGGTNYNRLVTRPLSY